MPTTQIKPDKQQVRDYMNERSKAKTPPPDAAEIRRMLGFGLLGRVQECPR